MIKIDFTPASSELSNLVIFISEDLEMQSQHILLDQQMKGLISKTLTNKNIFDAKFATVKSLHVSKDDDKIYNILLVGIGDAKKLNSSKVESLGGKIAPHLIASKIDKFNILIHHSLTKEIAEFPSLIASGIMLASYKFDKYFTKNLDKHKRELKEIRLECDNHENQHKIFNKYKAIIDGVFLARNLITEAPNKLHPESYAEKIVQEFEDLDVEINILGEREMSSLGMGALLGVGQGSIRESKLVIMHYKGKDDDSNPVAFVGKGVTFDTGGISLKPAAGMEDMKYDMSGSAAVVGVMKTLALRKAKVNAVGIVGLVENMPGGGAQRPSDIVTSMSGQTIEVLNTDAEGRLVLADALWYVQEKFSPSTIIDLATLTGAIVVSLGSNIYGGLFSNNDELSQKLTQSGELVSERLWRFPLGEEYNKMIDSEVADMKNIGERGAGSITAAEFLHRFIKPNVAWAHLDIAGMAWSKQNFDLGPKGAVGYGVRLLNKFIEENYE